MNLSKEEIQRRKDKAYLLWDLKERKFAMKKRAESPDRDPFLRGIEWDCYDDLERMINLVKEISVPNHIFPIPL